MKINNMFENTLGYISDPTLERTVFIIKLI